MLRGAFDRARPAAATKYPRFAKSIEALQLRDLRAKSGMDKEEKDGLGTAQAPLGHSTSVMTAHYVRQRLGKLIKPTIIVFCGKDSVSRKIYVSALSAETRIKFGAGAGIESRHAAIGDLCRLRLISQCYGCKYGCKKSHTFPKPERPSLPLGQFSFRGNTRQGKDQASELILAELSEVKAVLRKVLDQM